MLQLVSDNAPAGTLAMTRADAMTQTRIAMSIRAIGREAWDACFPGEVEGYDYLLAVEDAGIEGFVWRYVALYETGRMIAAMPIFLTEYQLETTVGAGLMRQTVQRIRRHFPDFLTLKLACLGSPCTEAGVPGFHPDVPAERRPVLLAALLAGFEGFADSQRCSLRGIKDFPENQGSALQRVFETHGYAATAGLPTAWLDVDFSSMEDYLGRLSAGTRKDMRRKLKSSQHIRTELRTDFADLLPRVMTLYNETRNRSEWQFEELTPGYFTGVLDNMPGKSLCFFYFAGETLLAANILVRNDNTLIDKFFCMDASEGRKHNLYYLSWFNNLSYCLDRGMSRYQSGQAYYGDKLRLGSQLTVNRMYFKHRNFAVQWLLRLISPWFAVEAPKGQPT